MNNAWAHQNTEDGFTVAELLVVMLVIGILAAIAVPTYLNQRKRAVDSTVKADVRNAVEQIETWMITNPYVDVPSFLVDDQGNITYILIDDLNFRQGSHTEAPEYNAYITGTLRDIKVSPGTTLKIVTDDERGGYRIFGSNPNGYVAKDVEGTGEMEGISYNSTMGGIDYH